MKKWIALSLAIVLALSLCACGQNNTKDPTDAPTTAGGNNNNGGNNGGNNDTGNNNNNNNGDPDKKVEAFVLKKLTAVDYENEDGDTLTFEYDALGNLIGMKSPTKQTTYDKHINRPLVENFPLKQERNVYTYDAAGRLLTYFEYDDEEGESEGYVNTYDEKGNLLSVEDYEDNTLEDGTRYTYDTAGNMLTETRYDENGDYYWITCTYDAKGNKLTTVVRDESGERSRNNYTYDENGKLIKNVLNYSINFVDRVEEHEEVYEYEYIYADGKLVETKAIENGKQTMHITFNANGDILTEIGYYANGKESGRTENTYDENGRLVKIFESGWGRPNDSTQSFTYDASGNMCQRTTDYGGKHLFKETFTYDANGNLVKLEGYKGEELRYEANLSYEKIEATEAVAQNAAQILKFLDLENESLPEDPDDDNW